MAVEFGEYRSLMEIKELFLRFCDKKVENGESTLFWEDSWWGGSKEGDRGRMQWGAQLLRQNYRKQGVMASNYVDTAGEEGRFHGHGHHSSGTTPTGAAASPKMRRSWSSAASASSGGGGHGSGPKCVCAPATHAGSFKCRLHRSSSHGHPSSSPTAAAAPAAAVQSSSSRTVAAQ
uniref:OJ000315_02.4 protein n=5 Tax=Oryza TaxID=4527 RepID=Q7F8W7_ORYSJ|nr:OJ000315_02.4 [Oryza sativa Japonica Group]